MFISKFNHQQEQQAILIINLYQKSGQEGKNQDKKYPCVTISRKTIIGHLLPLNLFCVPPSLRNSHVSMHGADVLGWHLLQWHIGQRVQACIPQSCALARPSSSMAHWHKVHERRLQVELDSDLSPNQLTW